jgi:hypothetical protein
MLGRPGHSDDLGSCISYMPVSDVATEMCLSGSEGGAERTKDIPFIETNIILHE